MPIADPALLAAVTLLHVLVFVYWLGGDLGAFVASTVVTRESEPGPARLAAAKILAMVDMAPRTALILAFPTGFTLAAAKGWASVEPTTLLFIWAAFVAWLGLAWRIHAKHLGPDSLWRKTDLAIRWALIAGLTAYAAGVLPGSEDVALFLRIKTAALAAAALCGLMIRHRLAPFAPAFAELTTRGPSPEAEAIVARSLAGARPLVVGLWALLLVAALVGLWAPI